MKLDHILVKQTMQNIQHREKHQKANVVIAGGENIRELKERLHRIENEIRVMKKVMGALHESGWEATEDN